MTVGSLSPQLDQEVPVSLAPDAVHKSLEEYTDSVLEHEEDTGGSNGPGQVFTSIG